jgi:broad specificity phosphatase PhoE
MAAIKEPIVIDPDFMEIGMGSSEGMTESEMAERWPGTQAGSEHDTMSFQSPDGESLDALAKRLDRALRRVASHVAASRIIVSHGVAGRVLRGLHLGLYIADALLLDAPIARFAVKSRRFSTEGHLQRMPGHSVRSSCVRSRRRVLTRLAACRFGRPPWARMRAARSGQITAYSSASAGRLTIMAK